MISYEKTLGYNKNKEGGKCMVCNHYYFKDRLDYQPYVCNNCNDFSLTVIDLNDFLIVIIKSVDYRVYIFGIDKKEGITIFENSALDDKGLF